jgi:hypothetical protein
MLVVFLGHLVFAGDGEAVVVNINVYILLLQAGKLEGRGNEVLAAVLVEIHAARSQQQIEVDGTEDSPRAKRLHGGTFFTLLAPLQLLAHTEVGWPTVTVGQSVAEETLELGERLVVENARRHG